MINLFFAVHDYSGAKTYANELLGYFSDLPGIAVHKVYLESKDYREYTEVEEGNILMIHIPSVKRGGGTLDKYAARCVDLMTPRLQHAENIIFHLNYGTHVKFAIEAKKRHSVKIIYTLHYLHKSFSFFEANGSTRDKQQVNNMDVLDREIIHLADKIICISEFSRKAICGQYLIPMEKTEIIYNGYGKIETRRFRKSERIKESLGFAANDKLILFAGRLLVEEKGIYILLEAFKGLLKDFPDARLVFANLGDFNEIMARCQDIYGRVTFTGKLPKEKLQKLYSIADIGVIPSNFEILGYVPIEMMLHQLPIVISDVPGMNELVIDGVNGVKCDVNKKPDGSQELEADSQDLCAKMKILLTDSALAKRLAKNARKHWKNNYTAGHMGTATMKLYKKVLSEQNQTFDHTYQVGISKGLKRFTDNEK